MQRELDVKDIELIDLYWRLQRKAHTKPGLRSYLEALSKILRDKGLVSSLVNEVGLFLESQGALDEPCNL